MKKEVKVEGMHCPSCEKLLASSFEELNEVDSAQASHSECKLVLELNSDLSEDSIKSIVEDCGFVYKA